MVRLLLPLLLLLALAGCQRTAAVDLEMLEGKARAGDDRALRQLVVLLDRSDHQLDTRAYAILLGIGPVAVPHLRGAVRSEHAGRREHAIAALGNFKDREAVADIAAVLADRRLARRYVAAWALGEIADAAGMAALLGALDDDDREVRRYATRALIKLQKEAVPALLAYLPQASPRGQEGAVRALGDIGDSRALGALLGLVDGANRIEVLAALGKLRDRRAEAALIEALADADWQVRMRAAMALGPLAGPAAVLPLRRTLEDEVHVVREWSARSLEMISSQTVTYRNEKGEQVPPYNIYR